VHNKELQATAEHSKIEESMK